MVLVVAILAEKGGSISSEAITYDCILLSASWRNRRSKALALLQVSWRVRLEYNCVDGSE